MVQKTYHIKDFTDGTFEKMLTEVGAMYAYNNAAQVLLTVFEQNWDRQETMRKVDCIHKALPKAKVLGITHNDWEMDNSTENHSVFSFLFFKYPSFSIYGHELPKDSEREVGRLLNREIQGIKHLKGVMLFMAEIYFNVEAFLEEADRGFWDISFFGAPAGQQLMAKIDDDTGRVFDQDAYHEHRYMYAVVFHGEHLNLKVSYNYGWTTIGKLMTITKMDGPFKVVEIDGQPASEIYRKYLGLLGSQINVLNMCEFPLVKREGELDIARIPLIGEQEGSLLFAASLRTGDRLRFSYGAQRPIFSEVEMNSMDFRSFVPDGMFLIICGNRQLFLKDQEYREVVCYQRYAPELAHLHGNSEIYRKDGAGGEMNSALVAVAFREGEVYTCPVPATKDVPIKKTMPVEIPLEYRVMVFMHAITEDMEEAVRRADAANKAKSNFLSNMSHEIRTPINAVLGMNEMILRESSEKQILEYAADIKNAGNTLLSLINDILDLSKIESGKMEIVPVNYALSSMIHDLALMIALRAKEKNLRFVVEVDKDLPSGLYGDEIRVRQVLTNILTNAVKYTPKGEVTMRISGRREGNREILHCEVEDTGIGIKEEDMPKLFEEFERIEEKRNRNIEGTGLGMNITLMLLQMMGSKLEVESVYGQGSKFYFDLEQVIVNASPIGEVHSGTDSLSDVKEYHRSFVAPDARVLVVDDNSLNRKVFSSLLKQTRIRIDEAQSGMECLERIREKKYDLIFLDHMMPELDGIETLHQIKAEKDEHENGDTPVFALTANAVSGAKEMYLEEGFDGFLSKPIVSDKLEQLIRDNLPKEKLLASDAEDEKAMESRNTGVPENLPAVDGLDWVYAWEHLPDRELLEQTLSEFYELLPVNANKLEQIYHRLTEADALTEYRIQVHGMKGYAATVGIIPLAGMANTLEYAARDGKPDIIYAMHDIFISTWNSYLEKLKGIFDIGIENEVKSEVEDTSLIFARLEMLGAAMEDLDVMQADEQIGELLSYQYAPEIEAKMQELKAAVTDLDSELAGQLIDEIVKEL